MGNSHSPKEGSIKELAAKSYARFAQTPVGKTYQRAAESPAGKFYANLHKEHPIASMAGFHPLWHFLPGGTAISSVGLPLVARGATRFAQSLPSAHKSMRQAVTRDSLIPAHKLATAVSKENTMKLAYEQGVLQALRDFGIVKEANLDEVLDHMAKGSTESEAWRKAYPGEPPPENLSEIIKEYRDTTEKDANMAWQQTLQNQGQTAASSQMPGYSEGGPVKKDGYLTDKDLKPYARVHKGERVVPKNEER